MAKTPRKTKAAGGRVLVGPAGWAYADWAGMVYPAPRPKGFHQATYLAEYFDTIEINTSFYHPMKAEHARQWIERVAGNPRFLFTAKLWQKFTHEDRTDPEDEKIVREGFDILCDAKNLARLEALLKTFHEYPLAVEVRHASWANPWFYELLHERGAGFCNIDQPVIGRSVKPSQESTSSAVGYFRLHGRRYDTWFTDDPAMPPSERYNYLYSLAELEPWNARVESVAERTRDTFVITNNHYQGKGVVNALQLIALLTGNKVKVPEPLRHHYPELESIADQPANEPMLFPIPPK